MGGSSEAANVDLAKLEAAELCIGQYWHGVYLTIHEFVGVLTWSNPYRTVVYGIIMTAILHFRMLGMEMSALAIFWGLHCVRDYNLRVSRYRSTYKNMHSAYDFVLQFSSALEGICTSTPVAVYGALATAVVIACGLLSRFVLRLSLSGVVDRYGTMLWLGTLTLTAGHRLYLAASHGDAFSAVVKDDEEVEITAEDANPSFAKAVSFAIGPGGGRPRGRSQRAAAVQLTDEDILNNALELHCMTGWQHVNHSGGIRTEEVPVDYCDKKAVRFTTVINCSLSCLIDTLQDEQFAKEFDPQLNTLETIPASAETGHRVAYYTNFKQVTPFVSARDFISTAATGRVPTDVVLKYGLGGTSEDPSRAPYSVWFQNNVSCGGKPVQKGYVRGYLYTFAYFAWCRPENEEGPDAKVYFANTAALDTAGKIPQWVLDAARGERAKIVKNIKAVCERRFKKEERFRQPPMSPSSPASPGQSIGTSFESASPTRNIAAASPIRTGTASPVRNPATSPSPSSPAKHTSPLRKVLSPLRKSPSGFFRKRRVSAEASPTELE